MSGKPKKLNPPRGRINSHLLEGQRLKGRDLVIFTGFAALAGIILVIKSFAAGSDTAVLWVDANGGTCIRSSTPQVYNDTTACTFNDAYHNAQPGDTILIKGGAYAGVDPGINGTTEVEVTVDPSKTNASSDVLFKPETAGDVNITADRLLMYGSHAKFQGTQNPYNFHLKNLIVNATQGIDNANHDTFENLDAKSFFIGPASYVTLKGGSYGPNQLGCSDTFGATYEPHIDKINGWETGTQPSSLRPNNITLDGVSIHRQTSADLACVHTGGMIMADGDVVNIRNSKFYSNNVYDIEVGDTGTTPDNVTLENNWFAQTTDQAGNDSGQREVQFAQDGAFDNWLVRFNSFVHGLDIKQNRPNSTHSNMRVVGNIGAKTDCNVIGVTYGYNLWTGGICAGTEQQITTLPYTSTTLSSPNFHLANASTTANNFVTATSTDYTLANDIDGDSRPQGTARDAGSDEAASAASPTCTVFADPGTVNSKVAAAKNGDVVCLNAGTYSGISVSNNTGRTDFATVMPAPGVTINVGPLNINNVSYLALQNVTFSGGTFKGHHLHLTDSTGVAYLVGGVSQILKVTGTINNADILIDHITYNDIPNPCTNNACVEGRISVMDGGNPSGITISNSVFSGGNSDGIQIMGSPVGVQIIGNEFKNILAANGTHTDAIQTYYSGSGTVIKDNYFHDSDDAIMAPDGGTNEQIINNVFDITGYPYDIVIWGWTGGLIQHNVFKYGTTCSWNSCGTLWVNTTSGLVVKDNVIGELKVDSGTISENYNLINVGIAASHDKTIKGLPTYVGGINPTTWAGFVLATGSKGIGGASDGKDIGLDVAPANTGSTPGDANGDKKVGILDLSLVLSNFGKTSADWTEPRCDTNGDGKVTILDLSVVLSKYGTTYP
jgi:hypothetical protein